MSEVPTWALPIAGFIGSLIGIFIGAQRLDWMKADRNRWRHKANLLLEHQDADADVKIVPWEGEGSR